MALRTARFHTLDETLFNACLWAWNRCLPARGSQVIFLHLFARSVCLSIVNLKICGPPCPHDVAMLCSTDRTSSYCISESVVNVTCSRAGVVRMPSFECIILNISTFIIMPLFVGRLNVIRKHIGRQPNFIATT